MKEKLVRTPLANILRILLVGASLLFLCGFAGYTKFDFCTLGGHNGRVFQ